MIKHILKFLAGGVFVALLGWFAILGLRYFAMQNDPEEKVMKQMRAAERQYAEDPYGGETPEETLALFIAALKQGDTELAAKYFVIDEQENWREQLSKIQEKGLIGNMVEELESTKLTKKTAEEAYFTLVDKNNTAISELLIGRNSHNNKWKIYEL